MDSIVVKSNRIDEMIPHEGQVTRAVPKPILAGKSPQPQLGCGSTSYDLVGDIAIIRVSNDSPSNVEIIAQCIMQAHRNVKTVLLQTGSVSGDLRLRQLEWVSGQRKYETVHHEFGCVFRVDLRTCYFSPRLSYERMRIAKEVKPDENAVNMFAGVGCFSVLMAKQRKDQRVYSIDLNSSAVRFMQENARLNRVEGQIVPILGDAKEVIIDLLQNVADRVVMPLPEKAYIYLGYAVMALKPTGGWIHYYDFVHASKTEDPVKKVKTKVEEKLKKLGVSFTVSMGRVVRSVGPRWYQVVLDVFVSRKGTSGESCSYVA